jgi:dTDP-4-dehydrorhamnose 3,5-epimerase
LNFFPQFISDVILIEPTVYADERGYFFETFKHDVFEKSIETNVNFVQDNESQSFKGVLRGLHYQIPPFDQSKLVRVIQGRVLDVAVDIRRNSKTFGQHVAVELSSENKLQLFIPSGFAHGYIVLSESAIFAYKVDSFYSSSHDRGIAYDDPELDINWKLPSSQIKSSDKDKKHPNLQDALDLFE